MQTEPRALLSRVKALVTRPDAPLVFVLVAMIVFGVWLRVQNLGEFGQFKWDEHHFVENARNYLAARPDWNDHPPLSKLLIAGAMAVVGDSAVGWRLASLLFGLLDIFLVAWGTLVAFGSRRAALIAAGFVAADGFFIAYSRTALYDGIIIAFGMSAMIMALRGRTIWHAVLAGLFAGLATSLKLSGMAMIPPVVAACFASRSLRRWTPLVIAEVPLVYYLQYAVGLAITGRPASPGDVIAATRDMVQHHLSFTEVHPFSSHWYTWFLPARAFFLRWDIGPDGSLRALFMLGNPLLWWASSVAVLAAVVIVLRAGPRRVWARIWNHTTPAELPADETGSAPLLPRAGLLFWLLLAWLVPLAFWVPSLRDSFLYHYMPSYAFALMLVAGFANRLYQRWRLPVLGAVLVVFLVSLFFAPLWGELPLSPAAADARIFRSWR